MSNTKSGIVWTDSTWNPTIGCTRVSTGCQECYAEKWALQLALGGNADYQKVVRQRHDNTAQWTGKVIAIEKRLHDPLKWQKPRMIFVNSMSDLFHEEVKIDTIVDVFAVMALAERHTFQVLTKRPDRMKRVLGSGQFWTRVQFQMRKIVNDERHAADLPINWNDGHVMRDQFLENVWLGVSAENQTEAEYRIPALLEVKSAVLWVSAEPLLSSIDFTPYIASNERIRARDAIRGIRYLDWVVVGGESAGPLYRWLLKHEDWVTSIRDQCNVSGTPFLFKQWGGARPGANGRMLEGRTWDEYPQGVVHGPD